MGIVGRIAECDSYQITQIYWENYPLVMTNIAMV